MRLSNPATTIPGVVTLLAGVLVAFDLITVAQGTALAAFAAGVGHICAQQGQP
jgi:hypothetical protein